MYSKIVSQNPFTDLITLDEVKRQCVIPISSTSYDDELQVMLDASCNLAQAYTRTLLTSGEVKCEITQQDNYNGFVILPFVGGDTSISSVTFDGVETTNYTYSDISNKLTIGDSGWSEVVVTYTTGLTELPQGAKLGILMLCNTFFNNRDDFVPDMTVNEVPSNSLFALDSIKRFV